MSCWSVHFSHFIAELKIHHLYSVIFYCISLAGPLIQKHTFLFISNPHYITFTLFTHWLTETI